jgi:hypothetical protein
MPTGSRCSTIFCRPTSPNKWAGTTVSTSSTPRPRVGRALADQEVDPGTGGRAPATTPAGGEPSPLQPDRPRGRDRSDGPGPRHAHGERAGGRPVHLRRPLIVAQLSSCRPNGVPVQSGDDHAAVGLQRPSRPVDSVAVRQGIAHAIDRSRHRDVGGATASSTTPGSTQPSLRQPPARLRTTTAPDYETADPPPPTPSWPRAGWWPTPTGRGHSTAHP